MWSSPARWRSSPARQAASDKPQARALAHAELQVVAAARRLGRLEALAADDARIHPVRADVTVADDVVALAAYTAEQFGACHVLVNNAGVTSTRRFRGRDDVAEVERVMDVNFFGTVRCTAAFAGLLFASAPAHVVNVASVAGKIGLGPPAYHASKFAQVGSPRPSPSTGAGAASRSRS